MTAVQMPIRPDTRPTQAPRLRGTRGWAVPVRLAWRDIRGHRTRSILAMVMIGTPVLLAAGLSTVLATTGLAGEDLAQRELGAADLSVAIVADADREDYAETTGITALTRQDIGAVVAGADTVEVGLGYTRVSAGERAVDSDITVTDPSSPLTTGMFDLIDGRLPRAAVEVAASPGLLERLDATIGDSLTIEGESRIVVGSAVRRWDSRQPPWLLAVPGTAELLPGADVTNPTVHLLVDTAGPLTTDQRQLLDQLNADYQTRADIAGFDEVGGTELMTGLGQVTAATALTLVVIELTLLAGPALAVGVRQQRRMLAQLAATGADARVLRRTVLTQALLLGVLGSVVGVTLGVLGALGFMSAARDRWPSSMGPLDVAWPLVAFAAVLGVLAATFAALAPAAEAARTSVAGALGLTRGTTGYPWRRAAVGGAVFVAAIVVLVYATRSGGSRDVGLASVGVLALTVGLLMIIPLAVATLLPLGRVLPPVWRLATRDAARAASRSVAAVAAVTAAVGGLVTVATFYGSINAFDRSHYTPDYDVGYAVVFADGVDGVNPVETVTAAIERAVPDASREVVATASFADYVLIPDSCPAGDSTCAGGVYINDLAVTDGTVSRNGADADELTAFVAGGGILVSPARTGATWREGPARIEARQYLYDRLGPPNVVDVEVRVTQGRLNTGSDAVVSSATAQRLFGSTPNRLIVGDGDLSNRDLDRLEEAVTEAGGYLLAGREYEDMYSPLALAVVIAAALALIGGTLTATALTLADARHERAVVAAIGAGPLINRLTAGATAVVIAALGGIAGVALGLTPGILAARSQTDWYFADREGVSRVVEPTVALPWLVIALVVAVIPLVLGLVVALVARGPSPLEGARGTMNEGAEV